MVRSVNFGAAFLGVFLIMAGCEMENAAANCPAQMGDARALCLRPDLSEKFERLREMRALADAQNDGQILRQKARMRAAEVFEFCMSNYRSEKACTDEKTQAEIDQLAIQLSGGDVYEIENEAS